MLRFLSRLPAPLPRDVAGAATGLTRWNVRWRRIATMLALFAGGILAIDDAHASVRGIPPTRFYAFEEIGSVTRANRLTFDAVGRVALVDTGSYFVLNDTTWFNLADEDSTRIGMLAAVCGPDGSIYYGALGSWGRIVGTLTGKLRPAPLVPVAYPAWVLATNFVEIVHTDCGIFFGGFNGIVYWDRTTGRNTFFELPGLVRLFEMGGDVFASSHDHGVRRLDLARGTLEPAEAFGQTVVDNVAPLSGNRYLMSTTGRQFFVYDHGRLANWTGPLADRPGGRITALKKLVDGEIAIAIGGRGLFIADERGEIHAALTTTEYQRVAHLANNEPGVLWAAAESGIAKVLYGSPVTVVGQVLGLPVSWPQVVQWGTRTVIASAGRVYMPAPRSRDAATRFELVEGQPSIGAWAIAANADRLLVGNGEGVFAPDSNASYARVFSEVSVARLVMIEPDLCFVLGAGEIAALRWDGSQWTECAPRVPGLGYPSIVHASKRAVWMEIGANRAARVWLENGQIKVRAFDTFPWNEPRWIHVSILGDTVILAGTIGRVFFDEQTGEFCEAPRLQELLDRAPYWVARVCEDDEGNLWASHEHGVFTIQPKDGNYWFDTTTYDVIDDRVPLVRVLPGGEVWASTGSELYHINKRQGFSAKRGFRPSLLSLRDRRTGLELLGGGRSAESIGRLPYSENSLDFRFFAGSYASRRSPTYQVRMDRDPWTSLGSGSVLTLSDLREGNHVLSVRVTNDQGIPGPPEAFPFSIAPPWYRAWYAYACYGALLVGLVVLLVRLSVRQTRARNAMLETMVSTRTNELQAAMQRLQQETQTSATLAERDRLAGEIHDSLEQGFTGLALQLETTANFPSCPPEVKSGLDTALNMVGFSRNELRHVVSDLHSARLESADLVTALREMIAQIVPEAGQASVSIQGPLRRLSSSLEHHLLRIAQEAITNAVKHASASRLEIALAFSETDVRLTIHDDGRGFDPAQEQRDRRGHFGLAGLRSRARKIGATLEITSRPGLGTCIFVRVQVESGAEPRPLS